MSDKEDVESRISDACSVVFWRLLELWPEEFHNIVGPGLYIAGGAIVSLALNETPHDWDFFIKDEKTLDYINLFFKVSNGERYELIAKTQNGITLKLPTGEVVQIVTRFIGPPSRIFKSFDFEHCKAYFDMFSPDGSVELHYNEDMVKGKQLVYTGDDDYPLNTLKRLVKFIRRGWTIENESVMNLALKLSKTDLADPKIRAEQTIGFYGSSMR